MHTKIRNLLLQNNLRMVVLDDDPTGIQTVHGCLLITEWSEENLRMAFSYSEPFFYILTNTRALTAADAAEITRSAMQAVVEANNEFGYRLIVVSRSDSCLRGHFPLESDVMTRLLKENGYKLPPVTFFVPAFIEAGRYTIEGIHYLKDKGILTPVSTTEFARDNVFAYNSSVLKEYIAEKIGRSTFPYQHLGIDNFQEGSDEDRLFLLSDMMAFFAGQEAYATVDALRFEDLQRFALALLQWMSAHDCSIVIRSSSTLPKALSGIDPYVQFDVESTGEGTGLFVVGSHVKKTTEQLNNLLKNTETQGVEVSVDEILSGSGTLLDKIEQQILSVVNNGKTPVVYTSRSEVRLDDADARQQLGLKVSDFLVQIVRNLAYKPSYIVAKGGITSHDILTKALEIKTAKVMGQIIPAVPTILTDATAYIPNIPYIIFPGNVGDENSLAQCHELLTP